MEGFYSPMMQLATGTPNRGDLEQPKTGDLKTLRQEVRDAKMRRAMLQRAIEIDRGVGEESRSYALAQLGHADPAFLEEKKDLIFTGVLKLDTHRVQPVQHALESITTRLDRVDLGDHLRQVARNSSSMASTGDTQLFDEMFTITSVDHNKYDRVGRFGATSTDSQTVMTLDINTELYPCQVGETLHVVLASSLALDGTKDDAKGWRDIGRNDAEPTLADMFEYVCHGKVYKFTEEESLTVKVFISFGGLLMALEGSYKKLVALQVDYVYLLVKK